MILWKRRKKKKNKGTTLSLFFSTKRFIFWLCKYIQDSVIVGNKIKELAKVPVYVR